MPFDKETARLAGQKSKRGPARKLEPNIKEKMELLDKLVENGIDPNKMMPGTGCCSLFETIELTTHSINLGVSGNLLLPPFYYKGVSDEGLYASYSEIIERIGNSNLYT